WDEAQQRYKGLRAGQTGRVLIDGQSLLVKPEVAHARMEHDAQQQATTTTGGQTGTGTETGTRATGEGNGGDTGGEEVLPPLQLRRFHASVTLDPGRLGRYASQIPW